MTTTTRPHIRRKLAIAPIVLAIATGIALATILATASPAARADSGLGPAFSIGLGAHPRLLPKLHAVTELDPSIQGRECDYVAKGYFKVAGRTVGRLPTFTGHATTTPQHLTLTVTRATRSIIRAAARRRGARRTTLTIVSHLTQTTATPTGAPPTTQTLSQDAYLTIPAG